MRSREQIYTTHVYNRLLTRNQGNPSEEYKRIALRFPAILRKTGLTHSMGYLTNDLQGAYRDYFNDIVSILANQDIAGIQFPSDASKVCPFTQSLSQDQYIYATQELLVVSAWIKHFCE